MGVLVNDRVAIGSFDEIRFSRGGDGFGYGSLAFAQELKSVFHQ